jgi:diketogulonate reductase-like aldo/keto reductase
MPKRPLPRKDSKFGTINDDAVDFVSIVGLGCSSFSTFFWSRKERLAAMTTTAAEPFDNDGWTVQSLQRSHPRVQEWIRTIRYAIEIAGITLLDTAPWYGHGTSEVVVGWALDEVLVPAIDQSGKESASPGGSKDSAGVINRGDIIVNTKIGRYEAHPPHRQFDFTRSTTLHSVQRSLQRMPSIGYIDVLQLHDPEFATSLDDLLLKETIPAMIECQKKGYCRALGMTGSLRLVVVFLLAVGDYLLKIEGCVQLLLFSLSPSFISRFAPALRFRITRIRTIQ